MLSAPRTTSRAACGAESSYDVCDELRVALGAAARLDDRTT